MSPKGVRAWPPYRWIVVVASLAGILIEAWLLAHTWSGAGSSSGGRLNDTISIATDATCLVVSCLIAWRAGDQAANTALALALTAVYGSNLPGSILGILSPTSHLAAQVVRDAGFLAGAYLFVRATQQFPWAITPADLLASPTAWGRHPVPRGVLSVLLRRIPLAILIACLTAIATMQPNRYLGEMARILVTVLGTVYFYISYRSGNAESRRKVLWLLAGAISSVMIGLMGIAMRAAVAQSNSEMLRTIVSVTMHSLNSAVQITSWCGAVFYAGAISPSLVIRKAVVYGATVALFLFGFAAVEAFIAEHLVAVLSITGHFASALIGGMFGLAFHPVRHRFEKLIERFNPKHHAVASWSDPGHSHANHKQAGEASVIV
jgi:hypothetical protein